ncbi:Protein CBG00818 [Caenorhabditis briggsae]|uniref:Protein CBG00818 n=1 Tax=Caenorhabditis briggsae TaxID=6238 RepID=A8WNW8_CAEBR|nr:Protein CBG00818 [Caenorhabditis briggsae]CAP22174.2 Protein CBG00818 [Caenorhabditis briggsae]
MIECSQQKIWFTLAILAIIVLYFLFDKANEMITEAMNTSKIILHSPEVYRNISARCEEAIECVENSSTSMKFYTLDGKYNPCMFFVFYQGPFATCADKLIAKVGAQIPCIETVFHDRFEIFDEANKRITAAMKSSKLILKSPEAYRNISRKCQEAIVSF